MYPVAQLPLWPSAPRARSPCRHGWHAHGWLTSCRTDGAVSHGWRRVARMAYLPGYGQSSCSAMVRSGSGSMWHAVWKRAHRDRRLVPGDRAPLDGCRKSSTVRRHPRQRPGPPQPSTNSGLGAADFWSWELATTPDGHLATGWRSPGGFRAVVSEHSGSPRERTKTNWRRDQQVMRVVLNQPVP